MPECIEKKKLLKAIEESEPDVMADYGEYYGSEWGISRGKLYEIIANLPTLTPPNEWVSVEDAMPAEDELVLCIVSGKPKPNIILDEAYQLGSWNKEDGWIIDEYLDWEDANVLWWMPLPAPPDRRPPEGEEEA